MCLLPWYIWLNVSCAFPLYHCLMSCDNDRLPLRSKILSTRNDFPLGNITPQNKPLHIQEGNITLQSLCVLCKQLDFLANKQQNSLTLHLCNWHSAEPGTLLFAECGNMLLCLLTSNYQSVEPEMCILMKTCVRWKRHVTLHLCCINFTSLYTHYLQETGCYILS